MASLNKVMIIGNLGRDPEVSYTPAGLAIAKFSVATTERIKEQEKTEWHRVTAFGKTAENCGRFLSKGRQVYVEGRLQTSSYEKDGITRYSTDIIANVITYLGGGSRNDSQGGQGSQNSYSQPQGGYSGQPPAPPRPQAQRDPYADPGFTNPPPDDDIPF